MGWLLDMFRRVEDQDPLIEFGRLSKTAMIPLYASDGAAGMDLVADEDVSIAIGDHALVKTNVSIKLPRHLEAQVRSRSGLALKHGIMVLNSPGTIDPDYRGGIGVILYNAGHDTFRVHQGDRIAQLVIAPFQRVRCMWGWVPNNTERGANGFGSTGISGETRAPENLSLAVKSRREGNWTEFYVPQDLS